MNPYFDQMILSASPVELIRMLYQRAIAKVREAREHLRENRVEERTAAINLSYRVLTELMNSIEPDAAPELSVRLKDLYIYMQSRLVVANMHQADAPLAEVLGLLITLSEAWRGIPDAAPAEQLKANPWETAGVPDDSMRLVLSA